MTTVSRHILAKKLGRRVSRGEYERKTTEYVDVIVFVSSYSRGKTFGEPRTRRTLNPTCPRFRRKKGLAV